MRNFGAPPPDEFAWAIGKTAATIRWVSHLEELKRIIAGAGPVLQDVIDALKTGKMVASEFPPGEEE